GSESDCNPLIDALPSTLVLDLSGKAAGEWISSSFRYAARELAAARAGSATVLAKLSELMFVEAVSLLPGSSPCRRAGLACGTSRSRCGASSRLVTHGTGSTVDG